jgi:hypothetical protein
MNLVLLHDGESSNGMFDKSPSRVGCGLGRGDLLRASLPGYQQSLLGLILLGNFVFMNTKT